MTKYWCKWTLLIILSFFLYSLFPVYIYLQWSTMLSSAFSAMLPPKALLWCHTHFSSLFCYMAIVFMYPWPQRSLPSLLQPCSCLPYSLIALKFWRKSTTSTYRYVIAVLFHELPGPLFSVSAEAASLFFFLHPFLVSVVKTFRKGLKQIVSFSEILIKADRNTELHCYILQLTSMTLQKIT